MCHRKAKDIASKQQTCVEMTEYILSSQAKQWQCRNAERNVVSRDRSARLALEIDTTTHSLSTEMTLCAGHDNMLSIDANRKPLRTRRLSPKYSPSRGTSLEQVRQWNSQVERHVFKGIVEIVISNLNAGDDTDQSTKS